MNLYLELKKGIFTIAIGKYSNILIHFVILAVLSRLLTPSEFGVVAIINVFLIFFTMLIDMGIGPAIIQNKSLTSVQTNRIFSFTVLLSLLLSTIFGLMSHPIAVFYTNPDLFYVNFLMALVLFSSGIIMVPQAVLLKRKEFINVNIALVVSNIVYGLSAIILALYHYSYYSLVLGSLLKNIVMFFFIFYKSELKLTKNIKITDLSAIYNFSKNQFLFNLINYFSRNLDKILIGKFLSTKSLAYYDKAYTLSLYPNQILTNVITPAIQPIMSEYENQKDIVKNTYYLIVKILAFIGMPITVFLYMSSNEVVYLLFGYQWTESIETFKILSLSIWIQMILSSTGSFFQSLNRTDLLLLSGILSSTLNIIGIVIGVLIGKIEYVALFLIISFSINFIQANYLLNVKIFRERQLKFYKIFKDPIIISIMVLITLLIIDNLLVSNANIILFIVKSIGSLITFLIGMKITGNIHYIKKFVKSK